MERTIEDCFGCVYAGIGGCPAFRDMTKPCPEKQKKEGVNENDGDKQ